MVVYNGAYPDIVQLVADVNKRLQNTGDTAFFTYNDKAAALMELRFGNSTGWGLCLELSAVAAGGNANSAGRSVPLLVALSYAPEKSGLDLYHLSALDSLAPSLAEQRLPGPVMDFSYPRGEYTETAIAGTKLKARVREHDAAAAQALIEREFALLRDYLRAPQWQAAWIRYYRMIYRDSFDRVADAARQLGRSWNAPPRPFAEKALAFVQGFQYERNLEGSDFVNLVSAVTEGRGDCDSRAMLFAILLLQGNIPSAMMVSRDYSHAMGLADIPGAGARFEAGGTKWLVAETTSRVSLGLINQEVSNTDSWLAILFD
jgi:hypothetical protein